MEGAAAKAASRPRREATGSTLDSSPAHPPPHPIARGEELRSDKSEHSDHFRQQQGLRRSSRVRRRPRQVGFDDASVRTHDLEATGRDRACKSGGDRTGSESSGGAMRRKRRGAVIRTHQRPGKGYTRCGSCGLPTPTRKRICPNCGVPRPRAASKMRAGVPGGGTAPLAVTGKAQGAATLATSQAAPQDSARLGEGDDGAQTGLIDTQADCIGGKEESVPPEATPPAGMAIPHTTWTPWLPPPPQGPWRSVPQHGNYWAWAPPPPPAWHLHGSAMIGHGGMPGHATYPVRPGWAFHHPASGSAGWQGAYKASRAGPPVGPHPWPAPVPAHMYSGPAGFPRSAHYDSTDGKR